MCHRLSDGHCTKSLSSKQNDYMVKWVKNLRLHSGTFANIQLMSQTYSGRTVVGVSSARSIANVSRCSEKPHMLRNITELFARKVLARQQYRFDVSVLMFERISLAVVV